MRGRIDKAVFMTAEWLSNAHKAVRVPGWSEKATSTTVEVLLSSCKLISVSGKIEKAVNTLEVLSKSYRPV